MANLVVVFLLFVSFVYVFGDDLTRCPTNLKRNRYLHSYGDNCYLVVNYRETTWVEADIECRHSGGKLATIPDKATESFLETTIHHLGHHERGFWIGLHDRNKEGHFQWVSGAHVTYMNWAKGQPNTFLHGFEDCVFLDRHHNYQWNDYRCQIAAQFGYICEYPKLSLTTLEQIFIRTTTTTTTTTTTLPTTTTTTTTTTLPTTTTTTTTTTLPTTTMTTTKSVVTYKDTFTTTPTTTAPSTTTMKLTTTTTAKLTTEEALITEKSSQQTTTKVTVTTTHKSTTTTSTTPSTTNIKITTKSTLPTETTAKPTTKPAPTTDTTVTFRTLPTVFQNTKYTVTTSSPLLTDNTDTTTKLTTPATIIKPAN